jgi:endonuclease/exonuclease/phosphatase (EEP) superfamily protein YafD
MTAESKTPESGLTRSSRASSGAWPPGAGGPRPAGSTRGWPIPGPLAATAAALFTALAVIGALPDLLFGLDSFSPFVQIISFRPLLLVLGAALLVLLAAVTWFRRGGWPFAAGLAAVLLVGGALVLPRALPDPVPAGGSTLTVLAFNTFEGRADVAALAELIRTERPDVIALPEAGARYSGRLGALIGPLGYRLHSSNLGDPRDIANVAVAVAAGIGEVRVHAADQTSMFPYVELTGGRLGALRFVAFHSAAPVPGQVRQWRLDLAALPSWCAGPTPAIVAGDFNATLDHSALRTGMAGCGDAAAQRGDGLVPTWGPSTQSRMLGPQIDHVMATAGIVAETFSVRELPGSDHQALLTRLRLTAPATP